MRLLKPNWVSHDGKPIFSVDIHPDGTRFATGGQGDNCGKVVVWNMAPVQNEKDEKDENVPKMLCMMDNHLACVNCVRWSNNGKYLASGGDDKVIMIWQTSRYAGASAVFGSGGSMVNVEQWRCVSTLRGHSGDVLDLAWSPHDAWLASCSIDNTIVVWNALKFPEQISVLRGHTGMVKGITWDPVGKYLASQSDDKSLRVWRTLDWQQDKCITKPFEECGGTTHVLRLGWSPDGQYLVSAHAMNNSGPTAQIIEREGWNISMDFVGHRKAVTVVRFNPNILSKKLRKGSEKLQQYSCCAIGSRDRSLSIWLTALKRPLVVTHDLFTNSVLDATWSKNGFEMLCCSWDGTVAYFDLAPEEIGTPFTQEEKQTLHQRLYGKSLAISSTSHSNNQVIETTAMLKLQQQHKDKEQLEKDSTSQDSSSKPLVNGGTPVKHFTRQIETKTPDGRRRITPIFLAPQPDLGEAPLPFSNRGIQQPTFSSSTERSKISVEKQDKVSGPTPTKIRSDSNSNKSLPWDKTPEQLQIAQTSSDVPNSEKQSSTAKGTESKSEKLESRMFDSSPMQAMSALANGTAKERDKDKEKQKTAMPADKPQARDPNKPRPRGRPPGSKKKLDLDGGPPPKKRPLVTPTTPHTPVPSVSAVGSSRIIYTTSGLELPTPSIDRTTSVQIYGTVGSDSAVVLEIENDVPGTALHKVTCVRGGRPAWETILTSKVITVAGNSHVSCVACEDQSVTLMSSQGRRLFPSMVLDSRASILKCSGFYVMVITSKGSLFVWNVQSLSAVIKNESLTSIIANNDIKIETSLLTEQGLPVITLSNGKVYTFKVELGCWVLLACKDDLLFLCSDHQSCVSSEDAFKQHGPLATLQAYKQRPGSQAARMFRTKPVIQQASTLTHLENQVAATLALKSSQEYHFWLTTYVRYLAQEGLEAKLREVFDELLGPVYKSKSSGKWEPTVLGVRKRNLLAEMLPFVGTNLSLQRLFTEYQEQLDSIKESTPRGTKESSQL